MKQTLLIIFLLLAIPLLFCSEYSITISKIPGGLYKVDGTKFYLSIPLFGDMGYEKPAVYNTLFNKITITDKSNNTAKTYNYVKAYERVVLPYGTITASKRSVYDYEVYVPTTYK